MNEAIEFAKWCSLERIEIEDEDGLWIDRYTDETYTDEELYQKYLNRDKL